MLRGKNTSPFNIKSHLMVCWGTIIYMSLV